MQLTASGPSPSRDGWPGGLACTLSRTRRSVEREEEVHPSPPHLPAVAMPRRAVSRIALGEATESSASILMNLVGCLQRYQSTSTTPGGQHKDASMALTPFLCRSAISCTYCLQKHLGFRGRMDARRYACYSDVDVGWTLDITPIIRIRTRVTNRLMTLNRFWRWALFDS